MYVMCACDIYYNNISNSTKESLRITKRVNEKKSFLSCLRQS